MKIRFERYQYQVLDVAQEIHMHVTGSSDCVHPDEIKRLVDFLRMRLDTWTAPVIHWREFDNTVKALLEAAIQEWEATQEGEA